MLIPPKDNMDICVNSQLILSIQKETVFYSLLIHD